MIKTNYSQNPNPKSPSRASLVRAPSQTTVFFLVLVLLQFYHASGLSDQDQREAATSDATREDSAAGVEAAYSLTYTLPFMDQAGTIYITYLVTPDEWMAHVDWILPGFINSVISPSMYEMSIHSKGGAFEFRSPYNSRNFSFNPSITARRAPYNAQDYSLRLLAFASREARVWRVPDDVVRPRLLATQEDAGVRLLEHSTSFGGKDHTSRSRVTTRGASISGISTTPLEKWERTHKGFLKFESENRLQWAASSCVISTVDDRFSAMNEVSSVGMTGDHLRHEEAGLLFYRGGRQVSTKWAVIDEVVIPQTIKVTLGTSGEGMLLRSLRLLHAHTLPSESIRSRIREISARSVPNGKAVLLTRVITEHFWRQHPAKLGSTERAIEQELRDRHRELLSKECSIGNRVGLLNNLVRLDAATDDSEDLSLFRKHLQEFLAEIGNTAIPEEQVSSLFNLLEMARSWKRPDLETVATEELERVILELPLRRQIEVLFFGEGPTETSDIYCQRLVNVILRCLDNEEVPETHVRAALIVAVKRTEITCRGILAPGSSRPINDEQRRQLLRRELLNAWATLRDRLRASSSLELQKSAERVNLLLEQLQED